MPLIDLAELQSGVASLNVGTVTSDRSGYIKPGLSDEHIAAYISDVCATYVEEWEPLLEGMTFRTRYVSISRQEADFLVQCYEEFERFPEDDRFDQAGDGEDDAEGAFDRWFDAKFFGIAECAECAGAQIISRLQAVMDAAREEWGCAKVFVKGLSRSAKDSVLYSQQFRRDFDSRVAALRAADAVADEGKAGKTSQVNENNVLVALLGAGKDAMASASARYFLRLFVRSERIYQDLTLTIEEHDKALKKKGAAADANAVHFSQGFAVREWVDIDIGSEFRAFVSGGRLSAMCQYDYLITSPQLQQQASREVLRDRLVAFWRDKVHPSLNPPRVGDDKEEEAGAEAEAPAAAKFPSYVVDLAVDCQGRVWVIELNPFQESTDGAMFSWAREGALLRGEACGEGVTQTKIGEPAAAFEFRVQLQPQKHAAVCLSNRWRGMYRSALDV